MRIHQYIARVSDKRMVQVWDIGKNVRGEMSVASSTSYKQFGFIDDQGLSKHYFIRDRIIYLSSKDKVQKLIRRINPEGQAEYFIICSSGSVYKMNFTTENRIMDLISVKDSTGFNLRLFNLHMPDP